VPPWAVALSGWLDDDGIERITDALGRLEVEGQAQTRPYLLALLADRYVSAGDAAAAVRTVDEAVAIVERTGERWIEAELYRLLAVARALADDRAGSAAARDRALEVARRQAAVGLAGRVGAVDAR